VWVAGSSVWWYVSFRSGEAGLLTRSQSLYRVYLQLIRTGTPDMKDCCACLSTATATRQSGRQLRSAARPPTPGDVVRHAKFKHAVDCCIWLKLNFFTKRHATRVIYRLTVKTLPHGPKTQFAPPDRTQTGPSCLVWQAVWIDYWVLLVLPYWWITNKDYFTICMSVFCNVDILWKCLNRSNCVMCN